MVHTKAVLCLNTFYRNKYKKQTMRQLYPKIEPIMSERNFSIFVEHALTRRLVIHRLAINVEPNDAPHNQCN